VAAFEEGSGVSSLVVGGRSGGYFGGDYSGATAY
jgi:hypothetical protein